MIKFDKLKRKSRAHISGEMTIYNAAALKEELMPVFGDDQRDLEIKLDGVTEIDSAGAQLLMLVKKECARTNRNLSLSGHSNAVLDTFELMGLATYFGDPVVLTSSK